MSGAPKNWSKAEAAEVVGHRARLGDQDPREGRIDLHGADHLAPLGHQLAGVDLHGVLGAPIRFELGRIPFAGAAMQANDPVPAWHPAVVALVAFAPFGAVYFGAGAALGLSMPIRFARR